jgi:glycerate 2-kinase
LASEQASCEALLGRALLAWRSGLSAQRPDRLLADLRVATNGEIWLGPKQLFGSGGAINLLVLGKSALALATAASDRLGASLKEGLLVQAKASDLGARWTCYVGGHPRADELSEHAGRKVLAWVQGLDPNDRLLVLMSGGASAMMELPAEGWSLARLADARLADLEAGMPIEKINHRAAGRSQLKDRRLAQACACPWRQLTINDVGDAADGLVSSGPFLGLEGQDVQLANHRSAATAAAAFLRHRGWRVRLGETLSGEAKLVGASLPALEPGQALVLSGETTVEGPYHGRGGRNLELIAGWLLQRPDTGPWALVSGAADGLDGSSGGAGAAACSDWLSNLDGLADSLARHDTAPWFGANQRLLPAHSPESHIGDLMVMLRGAD